MRSKRGARRPGRASKPKAAKKAKRGSRGRVVAVRETSTDTAQRKRAESALRETDERFAALLSNLQSGVALVDEHGQFVLYNASFLRIFGLSSRVGNVNSQDWSRWEVFAENGQLLQVDEHPVRKAALTGKPVRNQLVRVKRPADGQELWLLVSAEPILKPDGRLHQLVCTYYDITERKQAERRVQRSRDRLELLSRTVSALLTAPDPQTVVEDLCNNLRRFLDCDVFFNFLLDSGARRLRLNACGGVARRIAKLVEDLELSASLCGTAARDGCRILAENLATMDDPRSTIVRSLGVRAYACHPLLGQRGEVIGTLSFGTRKRDAFSAEDLELMKTVTDHVAVAMQRRKSEAELRGSEARLQAILDQAPCGITIRELPSGKMLLSNNRAGQMMGDVASRFTDLADHGATHADARPHRLEDAPLVCAAERGETIRGEEFVFDRADGQRMTLRVSAAPIHDLDGKTIAAISVFDDITERKRAEEALRQSEQLNRTVVQNTTAIILRVDPQARITFANRRALEFFGYSEEELLGRPVVGTIVPARETSGRDLSEMVNQIATNPDRFHSNTNENLRKDGGRVWLEWTNSGIYDGQGRLQEFLSVGIDVTERRRAEEALKESEQRFRVLADGTSLAIWVTDAEGRNRFVNRACCEFFGMAADSFADYGWDSLLHPEDRPVFVAAFTTAVRERKSFQAQARVRRHDGAWRWTESCGEPRFSPGGEFLGMGGSTMDITERREFQRELQRLVTERTAKLQELVGDLEHFSYTITHDMRAPLRAMAGFGELVMESCADCERRDPKELVQRIMNSAARMDCLITDALSYSRSVRQELPLSEVDTGALLRGMLNSYPELQPTVAHIRVEGELPVVLGNEAGLTQCFSNLLGNAVKFVKPGELPEIRIWAEKRGIGERIWVEDNGIGISKDLLPRLFGMFSRGSNKYEGTGIGLALVRKVAQRMGGRVGVESETGRGSRFWLELREAGQPDLELETAY